MKNKVVANASWIIIAKVVQALISFGISILTARYLGPSNYGLISYAASIAAFLVPVMQLGINSVLVQEIVNNPEDEGKTLGTSLVLTSISAVICILGIISFSLIANAGEKETIIVCALYSSSLLFRSIEMIQYWFQAKYLAKYTSIAMIIAYIIVAAYRLFILATGKSIYWFALTSSLDFILIAVILILFYHRVGSQKLGFSKSIAGVLLSKGKYFMLSGVMVTIFGQTDRIMLKIMVSDSATGYYAIAATLVSYFGFVFAAIIDSMRPLVLENKIKSQEEYENKVISLYSVIIYLAFLLSIFFTIFAGIIVRVLYGEQYLKSISILQILAWYSTFSYYGGAKDVWILAEGKQKYLLYLNIAGALCNVGLNLILIPYWGPEGAAVASLFTQIFTNVIMGFIIKELRPNNKLMLKSLNLNRLIDVIKNVKGS